MTNQKIEKPSFIYAKFENDKVITRAVQRGRKPRGYIKCQIMDDGKLKPVNEDTTIPEGVKVEPPKNMSIVDTDTRFTLQEIRKCIKPMRVEQHTDTVALFGCDIIGECPIEYLEKNPIQARIEINTKTGDISLWELAYEEGHPDIVLRGAIKTEFNVTN